ncbi:hypothetical protein L3Y34_009444 [Caenorhabditis briggsae]|uniref:Uncharacterized protein n=1 Tax=Caenorhabditis briggsae TaxID=6238 RepID=A0AAE9A2N6_CAEBR|nr:hypothetical protein L3Y34_009444 [Caenorhabditis briggsae]
MDVFPNRVDQWLQTALSFSGLSIVKIIVHPMSVAFLGIPITIFLQVHHPYGDQTTSNSQIIGFIRFITSS